MSICIGIGNNLLVSVCASIGQSFNKKVAANFPINVLKKKNKVEEGGVSSLEVKREHEKTYLRAHKMMRGKVEPFAFPTVVHAAKQNIVVPQMTSP